MGRSVLRWLPLAAMVAGWYAFGQDYQSIDGLSQTAYLRSALVDGDFCLDNQRLSWYWDQDPHCNRFLLPSGYVDPLQPIGTSLLTLPWGLLGLAWAFFQNGMGRVLPFNGDTVPFVACYSIGTFVAVVGALIFLFRCLADFSGKWVAGWSVVGTFLATPLVWYAYRQPTYSHSWSFAVETLAVCLWWKWRISRESGRSWEEITFQQTFVLGMLQGVAQLVRVEAVAMLVVLGADLIGILIQKDRHQGSRISLVFRKGMGLFLGWVVAFSPQMSLWKIFYGTIFGPLRHWVGEGMASTGWFEGLEEVFFGRPHGIGLWHPWIILAIAGLAYGALTRIRGYIPLSLGFMVQIWYYSRLGDILGYTYGYRYICLLLPFAAFGMVMWWRYLWIGRVAGVLTSIACILNLVLFFEVNGLGWLADTVGPVWVPFGKIIKELPSGIRDCFLAGWLAQIVIPRPWAWFAEGVAGLLPLMALALGWGSVSLAARFPEKTLTVSVAGFLALTVLFPLCHERTTLWTEILIAELKPSTFTNPELLSIARTIPRRLPAHGKFEGRFQSVSLMGTRTWRFGLNPPVLFSRVQGSAALMGLFEPGEVAATVRLLNSKNEEVGTWKLLAGRDIGTRDRILGGLNARTVGREWDAQGPQMKDPPGNGDFPLRVPWMPRRNFVWSGEVSRKEPASLLEISVTGSNDRGLLWYGMVGLPEYREGSGGLPYLSQPGKPLPQKVISTKFKK